MSERAPKLVLRLVVCVEDHSYAPVGPRFRRGDPMPYTQHYVQNHGYNFDPEDFTEAEHCREQLQKYIDKGHAETTHQKKATPKKDAHQESVVKELVDTPAAKVGDSVPKRRYRAV